MRRGRSGYNRIVLQHTCWSSLHITSCFYAVGNGFNIQTRCSDTYGRPYRLSLRLSRSSHMNGFIKNGYKVETERTNFFVAALYMVDILMLVSNSTTWSEQVRISSCKILRSRNVFGTPLNFRNVNGVRFLKAWSTREGCAYLID